MRREPIRQYAKALFRLEPSDHLQKRVGELRFFAQLVKSQLLSFFQSPTISCMAKEQMLLSIWKREDNLYLIELLKLMIKRKRLQYIGELAEEFALLVYDKLQMIEVQIFSSEKIEEGVKAKLAQKIERFYRRQVLFIEREDPHTIGGVKIVAGSYAIDFSIKKRLHRVKESLLTVRV